MKEIKDPQRRRSGILLHITSLPSCYGAGDFGPWAYEFAEFLEAAGQSCWQILPITPTDPVHGNSPYHSSSAFALNPLFLSPRILEEWEWIKPWRRPGGEGTVPDKAQYEEAISVKQEVADAVFQEYADRSRPEGYKEFCHNHSYWLEDYALFTVIKNEIDSNPWIQWPTELRDRDPSALAQIKEKYRASIEKICLVQFLLFRQWMALKDFCNAKGIFILGDMPIYVVHDSVDVWTHPELFNLDEGKRPLTVAGVPPDYFSDKGQLWGNPVYRWDVHRETGYEWWIKRIRHNIEFFDMVRIDHFRGFVGYWEVPASETDAINGRWVQAPAWDFFACLKSELGDVPIIAEDLGVITPDVTEVRGYFGFPGMKVLLFAFGEDLPTNPYAPHNFDRECVVYTGTHDNNTVCGWFENEATPEERERVRRYLGRHVSSREIHMELIRLAMMSVAKIAIFPMQDVLGLGEDARMNRPATNEGNWLWRLLPQQMDPALTGQLREITEIYGRL